MEADRNLLFGVLALQLDYIDPTAFSDACALWAARKDVPLAEILVERNWIQPDERREIDRLLDRKVKKHQGDPRKALGDAADQSVRDAIRDVNDDQLQQTLRYLPPAKGQLQVVETIDYPPDKRSRYTLTRMHSQGGLGRVWLAQDRQMNRQVALKEIRPDKSPDQTDYRRFVREAQVTGQLEHPNIVPVYELIGETDENKPFYTMRYLRGQTLRDAINEYHRVRRGGVSDPLQLRRLLNDFVDICNAVGYAHSRGVVHRDLKPANVMLGAFGEVVLLDWGLAKLLDQASDDDGPRPVASTREAETEATEAGRVLGTLGYMSPEQANGRIDLIDGRTDVYGLGAILFAILSGEHPHKGQETVLVVQQIISGPTPRVRGLDATIPPALDAICGKAMSKERRDRYHTALELADDVQRWLADEPVSVYAESRRERAFRWLRRHRTWAQALAATFLIVAVVSSVAALLIGRALHNESVALANTETALRSEALAKAEATRRFQQALETIDTSLTQVSQELLYFPGMQDVRTRLIERAAEDYRRFAEDTSDDPNLQAESGRSYVRLGDAYLLLGKQQDAIAAFRSSHALFDGLTQRETNRPDLQLRLAKCCTKLGSALGALGQREDSQQQFTEAQAKLDRLVHDAPDDTDYRAANAENLVNQASLLSNAGDHIAAVDLLTRAIREFTSVDRQRHPTLQLGLSSAQVALGQAMIQQGRNRDAVAEIEKAIPIYDALIEQQPDHPDLFEGRAVCRIHVANAWQSLGLDESEEAAYRQAISDYQALVKARPEIPQYRENLAITGTSLGRLLHQLGRNTDAQRQLDDALQQFTQLVNNSLPLPRYYEELAAAGTSLGRVLLHLDQHEQAETQFRSAIEVYQQVLTEKFPTEPHYRRGLAISTSNLGRCLHKLGKHDEARAAYEQAIHDFNQALLDATDGDPYSLDALAWTYYDFGELLTETGQSTDAAKSYQAARDVRGQLAEISDDPEYLHNLAWLLVNCRHPDSRDPTPAIAAAKKATQQVPDNAKYWCLLGMAYFRAEHWDESLAALEKAVQLRSSPQSFDLFFLAMLHWKRGDQPLAREAFQRAVDCPFMNENRGNAELLKLHREAAAVLGLDSQAPKTDGQSK